uniref:THO complex subunit 7 n=1 Tax=Steinernema glaseri TaxID=37863 RepID=A0A1I7Y0V9_9BILA
MSAVTSASPKKRAAPKPSSSSKEDLENIQVKKRIKIESTETQKTPKTESYNFPKTTISDLLRSEDEQLKNVCTEEMRQTFSDEADSLLGCLRNFMDKKGELESSKDFLYDDCIDKVMKMRYAHRMSLLKTEERNEQLLEERASVDKEFRVKEAARVRLFNVRNEIESCLDIRAPEEECELIPMPEFLEKVPSAKIEEDSRDARHQERLARLRWELEERQGLQEKLQELENRRDVLVTDIGGKEGRISSMMPMFEKVREAARPLYDLMGLPAVDVPSTDPEPEAEQLEALAEEPVDEC